VEQDTAIFAEYPAQTYARDLVEVRGRVDGYVEKWLFKPGQHVRAGQALYILDVRPYRAQVEQAEGTLREAEADLSFAKQQVSLLEAEANLESAKANLLKAQQDYDRLKPLVEQDAAARQDLDASTAALRAAESNVRAKEATARQARLTTDTQIQSTQGRLQQQRGTLEAAKLNVQYGTIRSPISGMIGDTMVPVGGLVSALLRRTRLIQSASECNFMVRADHPVRPCSAAFARAARNLHGLYATTCGTRNAPIQQRLSQRSHICRRVQRAM
jgi:multidrug resistance efflux pump